jgi:cell division transport system ATP-binding protein
LLKEYPGIVYRCINQRLEDITKDYNNMSLYDEEVQSAKKVLDYSDREDLSM